MHNKNVLEKIMKKLLVLFSCLFFLFSINAFSDSIGLSIENDFIAGTDSFYSHGTRIQWLSETNELWGKALDYAPIFDNREKYIGFNLSQYIYTPSTKMIKEWQPEDRPYCGWLYGGFMGFAQSDKNLDFFEADIGTIGEYSYARETQTFVHKIIGSHKPMGWDNQIENQIGADAVYQHKYLQNFNLGYFDFQLIPHGGGCFGNVHDYVDAGLLLRLGHNIPKDFGVVRMEPASRLFGVNKIGYYVFADTEGKYVMRNLTIEGETPWGKNDIELEPVVGEVSLGAALRISRFDIFYSYNIRSKEFDKQEIMEKFGTLGLSWIF